MRRCLDDGLDEASTDHVTISRTQRLLDEATHQAVFTFVLTEVARRGMLKGKTIGIDATTLEANAAMRSIVRGGTRARVTWNTCEGWPSKPASTLPMTPRCGAWIASGRRRPPIRSG